MQSDTPQTEQLIQAIKKHDLSNAIVKIIYHIPKDKTDKVDLKAVYQACSAALFVVGIIPVRNAITRERRAAVKVDMDMAMLLNRYFSCKPELSDRKKKLIQKALELEDQVNSFQTDSQ